MELALSTFKKLETVGWIILISSLIFYCGHAIVFLAFCVLIRKLYMRLKTAHLGLLDTKGKTVLITGCDTGFGHGLAKRLYEKGFTVLATCLNPDSEGGKALKEFGSNRLKVLPLDVGKDDSVSNCLRLVKEECARTGLWGLVNNAGLACRGDVELVTMDQYLEAGNVNMFGMVRTCKAFLPLIRQARGRIVNVTSVMGLVVMPYSGAYNMTKFGAEAFSETLRQDMSPCGVKVSIVEPCHYAYTTGLMNDANWRRLKENFDDMWREASEEAKQYYGQAHLKQLSERCEDFRISTATKIDPVLDAHEDALRNPCPRVRYLVAGSSLYIDPSYVLAVTRFLPQTLHDKIRERLFPYVIYK